MNAIPTIIEWGTWIGEAPTWSLVLLKATAWLSLVWLVHFILRKVHPRGRVLLWRGAAGGVAALVAAVVWVPSIDLPIPRPAPTAISGTMLPPPLPELQSQPSPTTAARASSAYGAADQSIQPESVGQTGRLGIGSIGWAATGIWLGGIMLLALRFVVGCQRVRRMVRDARPAPETMHGQCREVCTTLGCRGLDVRVSDIVSGPLLIGPLRPVLLLPKQLMVAGWQSELPAVFAHEIAHLSGKDLWWNTVIHGLSAILWFHPLAWRMSAAHAAACDEACDAAAAQYVGEAGAYRRTLARVAAEFLSRVPLAAAMPMARTSQITRRVRALERPRSPFSSGRSWALWLALAGIMVFLGLAGLSYSDRGSDEAAYENAPASENLAITVGPNTFRVNAVLRWDRDGSTIFGDGTGNALTEWAGPVPMYASQAVWMDIVNIYLSPGGELFDVLEMRLFDHQTRELIRADDRRGVGYHVRGSVVQLRSVGELLPDMVDVWFRVNGHQEGDPIWRLPAEPGASAQLEDNALSVRELRGGQWSYSVRNGEIQWRQFYGNEKWQCTVVFDWLNEANDKYQICAVSADGKRFVPDFPHFVGSSSGTVEVIEFDLPLNKVHHFELRPFRGRDTFYFSVVRLPQVSEQPLLAPPAVTIAVNGQEGEFISDALDPIGVKVQVWRGTWATGVSVGRYGRVDMVPGPIGDLDSTTTVIYDVSGLAVRGCYLSFLDTNGQAISPGSSGSGAGCRLRLDAQTVGFVTVKAPLATIGQIQLTLGRPSELSTEHDDSIASMHTAAKRGAVDPVAELLAQWVDVNAKDNDGHTPGIQMKWTTAQAH